MKNTKDELNKLLEEYRPLFEAETDLEAATWLANRLRELENELAALER